MMHSLLDSLHQPGIRMRFDLVGKNNPKIVKRVYRDLNRQACHTAYRSIHQQKVLPKMLSKWRVLVSACKETGKFAMDQLFHCEYSHIRWKCPQQKILNPFEKPSKPLLSNNSLKSAPDCSVRLCDGFLSEQLRCDLKTSLD